MKGHRLWKLVLLVLVLAWAALLPLLGPITAHLVGLRNTCGGCCGKSPPSWCFRPR